jgi:hypothetical protein
MIGKPSWFSRRKYLGWGVFPSTWQGWAYLAVAVALISASQALPVREQARLTVTIVLAVVLAADLIHIMVAMPRDEREKVHEAIAERNALWVMLAVLVIGVGEQAAASVAHNDFRVDPIILAALVGAVLAKAVTNIYLDRND